MLLATCRRRWVLALLGFALFATSANAQYPSKRILFIVPFAAGGSNDILARAIGQKLSEAWQVPVVVENQGGASGSLGTARVAKAEPEWTHDPDPVVHLYHQRGSTAESAVRSPQEFRRRWHAGQGAVDARGVEAAACYEH